MKYYSSSISKKQVNVIFAKAKAGELKIERWVMRDFYSIVNFDGIDWNGSTARLSDDVSRILDNIFEGNIEKAQSRIDFYTKSTFDGYTDKGKATLQRELVK